MLFADLDSPLPKQQQKLRDASTLVKPACIHQVTEMSPVSVFWMEQWNSGLVLFHNKFVLLTFFYQNIKSLFKHHELQSILSWIFLQI
jgi:hypothetical protein